MRTATIEPRRTIWLTPKMAAAHLEVSDATIRRLIKSGALKPCRVGHQLRFDQAALDRYIHNQTV